MSSALTWRKSTRSSQQQACVEVADTGGLTLVRDSKLGDASPILSITSSSWRAFVVTLRADDVT